MSTDHYAGKTTDAINKSGLNQTTVASIYKTNPLLLMNFPRSFLLILFALTLLRFVNQSQASMTYSVDDGVFANHISVGGSGLLLNAFQTVPSGTSLQAVEIAFTNQSPISYAFDIVLFFDPNNDGSLLDGVEIFRESNLTPSSIDQGIFVMFALPAGVDFNVGDWFFIGVEEKDDQELAISTDAMGGNFSWIVTPAPDPAAASLVNTFANISPVFARDLMIRVVAVPEISSSLLVSLGLIFGLRRRNHSC